MFGKAGVSFFCEGEEEEVWKLPNGRVEVVW